MPANHHAWVALLTAELMVPWSDSLKSKRRVIKSIKDRLSAKFNASVAEIDFLDEWQRATIAVAMVSNDRGHLERSLQAVAKLIEETSDVQMLGVNIDWL
ncbi:MAG: DUF503 domain-containing protein [Chromatiales bacterium]|jgi:uncharacterized protein YlxP (DUF503 family)|nr:DUF503 domain-containing protein [Chromatiales bacterium]